ncbi:hypothetical protein [Helicobacter sp. L8]|uniref:hypothetical protein n=1 Tax=Helicobacter sp. L8 TaxID=2316078 RepID=UPI0013CE23CB
MLEFLAGKGVAFAPTRGLFKDNAPQGLRVCPTFSQSAQVVLQAGKKLYAYYHAQEGSKPNASFYDIKEFFAGRNAKGKLNPPSKATDAYYKELYSALQESLEILALEIAPKVREFGFLR